MQGFGLGLGFGFTETFWFGFGFCQNPKIGFVGSLKKRPSFGIYLVISLSKVDKNCLVNIACVRMDDCQIRYVSAAGKKKEAFFATKEKVETKSCERRAKNPALMISYRPSKGL